MKKIVILFVLCSLLFCFFGQGTAYVTQSNVRGAHMMIRQWGNVIIPGSHATYFTNYGAYLVGNIGVTDVYNHLFLTLGTTAIMEPRFSVVHQSA